MFMPCSRLSGLEMFPHLEELVLDSNAMTEDVLDTLPQLPNLNVLSLNKNQVWLLHIVSITGTLVIYNNELFHVLLLLNKLTIQRRWRIWYVKQCFTFENSSRPEIAVAGTSRRAMRERCTSMIDSNTNKPDLTQWSNPRRSYCDFSVWPYDLEHCVTSCAQLWDNFHQIWPSTTYPCMNYSVFWCWYVMSRCDLDLWPWTFMEHQASCDKSLYKIWAK